MKTTENISLSGYAFTIEIDAYEELGAYLEEIKTCFSGDTSADEIVADIEERIAELLHERCVSGMVVNLAMIQEIKKRIGNPSQLSDTEQKYEEEPAKPEEKKNWKNKRMYRNMEERIFGGVCSGLGTYFGLDKVIFRIFFLVFFLIGFLGIDDGPFFGFSLLAYICLWIAMPAARTAEQKREMKGRPIHLENYRSKDFDFEKEIREVAQSPTGRTFKRAGGIFLGSLLLIFGLGGLLGCIFIPAVPELILNEVSPLTNLDEEELIVTNLLTDSTFWSLIIVMLGLFCVWFIYNGVMLLFDLKTPSWRPGLILFISWLISLFVIAGWVVRSLSEIIPTLINI